MVTRSSNVIGREGSGRVTTLTSLPEPHGATGGRSSSGLVRSAGRRPETLGPDGVRRLGTLYRATAADLALARRGFAGDPVVAQLGRLVGGPPARVRERATPGLVPRVRQPGYWRRVRERPVLLLVSALLLFGPWGWPACGRGVIRARRWRRARASTELDGTSGGSREPDQRGERRVLELALHQQHPGLDPGVRRRHRRRARVGVRDGLKGVLFGVITGLSTARATATLASNWITAHGVLELSCIVVAGAAGMRMGWALVVPGHRRRGAALAAEARAAAEIVLGTTAWLVVAGLLEGFVTPERASASARRRHRAIGAVYWRRPARFWGLRDSERRSDTTCYSRARAFALR